jgi:glycine cleavage system H protein
MPQILYSTDHTWVRADGSACKVGISDFAQKELGEIAFVELPEVGLEVEQRDSVCSIDSLKSTSEIYAPISGTVVKVNGPLASEERCGLINSDPLGEGWLFAIEAARPEELSSLMSQADYERYIAEG